MTVTQHDLIFALAGGAMIGTAAGLLLLLNGRIAGISGIVNGAMEQRGQERSWRVLFVAGIVAGAFVYAALFPDDFVIRTNLSWTTLAVAGFLVGIGTRMGGGCTSGHGVCGVARFSRRSIIATVTFIMSGFASTFIVRHLIGIAN